MASDGYPVFIFGWIAGGWEVYSHNYRHYIKSMPRQPQEYRNFSMTANLVLRIATTSDTSAIDNVLTASPWRSGND